MGFFDSLKSVVNMVTGGAAKVTLEVGAPSADRVYPVRVQAVVDASDLKIEKVYLRIEGYETVTIKDYKEPNAPQGTHGRDLNVNETTYSQEATIAPAQQLKAKETYNWTGSFQIPADLPPNYKGKNCTHVWRVSAALDATGNDPSTDWVTFPYRG